MASVVVRPAALPRWFWFASLLGCTPGFKKSRCKRLLKKTMSRIKLLKGRREVQVRQLRRDVAQLLQLGQQENAENRLDRLWKEHSLLSAYIKIGEYCQFLKANLRNIAGQRECPMDLKEPLASLCFSASCCADLPELQEIRDIMVMKYGNTFLTSAHELLPGEHVNRLFLDAFSTKHPLEVSKKALLKSIVAEYNVVQPKKSTVHSIGGASQKTATPGCNTSLKEQSRHEFGSEGRKQDPKLNALEQEEKHKKQSQYTTSVPAGGDCTEEHATSPHGEVAYDRKMVGQHKNEQKDSHFQGDSVQCGVSEKDQDLLGRTALPRDRHGKENFKNRLKAFKKNKKNARVSQAEQTDQLTPSNRMSFHEKSGPDERGNEVLRGLQHVHRNSENGKTNKVKEVQGFVIEQHLLQESVDSYGHAKHRENKLSKQEICAETNQHVLIARSLKHGCHDETLAEDCIAHQMLQQRNFDHKKHDSVDREVHTRPTGKVRLDGIRHTSDNEEHERPLCHMDPTSRHYGRSSKKFTNEFDNEQLEKSLHRRNHHAERGTKVDAHRIDLSISPGEADYGIDYRQSPLTGNRVLPEQREPSYLDRNFGETKHKHKSRSNGKSRPSRATNEQLRSPCKRNQHVEGEIRFEKPRPGTEAYETGNWQALAEYGDGTRKVQKEKGHSINKTDEITSTRASSVGHHTAHMLQKGRKQQARKHHFGEPQQETSADHSVAVVPERAVNLSPGLHIRADDMRYDSKYHARRRERNFHLMENSSTVASSQQEAWADYNEAVVPERGMNLSSGSYIRADDTRYDSKYSAREREKNFHLMADCPPVADIETAWDLEAARQNESAREPCMDGKLLLGDGGLVRQKQKRLSKKHSSDHANSIRPKQEGIAEGTESIQTHQRRYTNGPCVPEDDSNDVAHREREHLPQWHNQFDPIPKGYEGSVAADTRAFPQVASAHGGRKEQKYPQNLREDSVAKPSSGGKVEGNPSPSRFSNPPQRPPPPVPPYRVSSMPNRKPLNSPPAMRQRCATLETSHVRTNHEPHVHPKLPEYEDLVASFAALKNKPARPPMD